MENYRSVGSRVGCTFCLVESAVLFPAPQSVALSVDFLRERIGRARLSRAAAITQAVALWLGRVYRSEGRRIYDYRRWLFFLSGLDRGGKRSIEHRQSNGFGENGDCTG